MTVILLTHAFGIPMLIGDHLVSGHEPNDINAITFPDHVNGITDAFPKGSGYIPRSMKRKIFILAKNIALGVSGSIIHMQALVRDLRAMVKNKSRVRLTELKKLLNAYADNEHGSNVFMNVSAMIILHEDKSTHYIIVGDSPKENCTEYMTDKFGKVVAIGSGQNSLLEEILRIDKYRMRLVTAEESMPRLELATSWNVALVSQLNKIDSISHKYLLEYWGGGYELIYYDFEDSRFKFLDKYTVVFWAVDLCAPEPDLMPIGFVSYFRGDTYSLYLVSSRGQLNKFYVSDVGVNEISSDDIDVSIEELNSRQIMNAVVVLRSRTVRNLMNFSNNYSSDKRGVYLWRLMINLE